MALSEVGMDASRAALSRAASRRITVLGATGSVGRSTLNLVASVRAREGEDACPIEALVARTNVEALAAAAKAHRARAAVVERPVAERVEERLGDHRGVIARHHVGRVAGVDRSEDDLDLGGIVEAPGHVGRQFGDEAGGQGDEVDGELGPRGVTTGSGERDHCHVGGRGDGAGPG